MLVVAAGGLAAVRLPDHRAAATVRPNPLRQLKAGWAEFVRHQWLWLLTAQWTVFSLVILAPVAVLGPVIGERQLGGASAWGAISSCLALGGVGGQLAGGRSRRPARPAFVIGCLVPVMTAEALALGLGAPLAVVALAAVVTGAAMGAQNVIFQTAMQTSVAHAVLARVTAIDLLGSEGGSPSAMRSPGRLPRPSARTPCWRPARPARSSRRPRLPSCARCGRQSAVLSGPGPARRPAHPARRGPGRSRPTRRACPG